MAAKFDNDLQFLMQCLREVLQELGHEDLAPYVPWLEPQATLPKLKESIPAPQRLVQLLSISFQLLNMIEENTAVQRRRVQQSSTGLESEAGLWPWALASLKEEGFRESQVQAAIRRLRVEPVLTAHPTEAKRASVLEHHRELYLLLVKRENQMWTPVEQGWLKDEIKMVLERLWRTGEIYLSRPDIAAELRNIMHYLKNVFPEILPWLDRRFTTAWAQTGMTSEPSFMRGEYPQFVLGTWVGGDRDGHPLVTAKITQETLRTLRLNALIVLRHKLVDLAKKTSLSDQIQEPPAVLKERLAYYAQSQPEQFAAIQARNPGESWRLLISMMIARLPISVVREHATELADGPEYYRMPDELMADLSVLHDSMLAIGAERLAHNELKSAVRTLQTFGFHSARLDIRQNSQFHDKAVAQLLALSGVADAASYPQWPRAKKLEFLLAELKLHRPLTLPGQIFTGECEAVISCYRVLRDFTNQYGWQGIGSLIVSMTHGVEDLLTVYLLAREAGLMRQDGQTLYCPLPVVPLFETIDDLARSSEIMAAFLEHPITKASLAWQARHWGRSQPMQEIMVGYSDSAKDGGVFASQWHLYCAEKNLQAVSQAHGVELCFFHGRGGTVSRGAGPIHRFLEAMPRGALQGNFRMTEQGETIARKYANFATAVYNLELQLASATAETLRSSKKQDNEPWVSSLMQRLSDHSQRCYQTLIRDPEFLRFYRQVTPIDILEHARIGSRPAKRTGQATIDDLRAIPWVFSWNQSRFYLPSWYGVGTALSSLAEDKPDLFARIREQLPHLKLLNYILHNVETTVASASAEIMGWYADLIAEPALRQRFMQQILDELALTNRMLVAVFGSPIAERRSHVVKTIALREAGLRQLHRLQIEQLREWRRDPTAEGVLEALLVTVNAIAGGLRNTG